MRRANLRKKETNINLKHNIWDYKTLLKNSMKTCSEKRGKCPFSRAEK